MDGEAKALRENEDVKEFYLGIADGKRKASATSSTTSGASAGWRDQNVGQPWPPSIRIAKRARRATAPLLDRPAAMRTLIAALAAISSCRRR